MIGMNSIQAIYGGNTNTGKDVSAFVEAACGGKLNCDFTVDTGQLGDPAPFKQKDFSVRYSCPSGEIKTAFIPGEAAGEKVRLNCPNVVTTNAVEQTALPGSLSNVTGMLTQSYFGIPLWGFLIGGVGLLLVSKHR